MPYKIEITDLVFDELRTIAVFHRRRIIEEINVQLTHQPTNATRNRKLLSAAVPAFEHAAPIWELRVGEFRVFYDVNEASGIVYIRAVRRKGQGQTTEDLLQ